MPVNSDDVEMDEGYPSPNAAPEPTLRSSKTTNSCWTRFIAMIKNVIRDPIFAEVILVVTVLLFAIGSSELGIYVGKAHDGHSK